LSFRRQRKKTPVTVNHRKNNLLAEHVLTNKTRSCRASSHTFGKEGNKEAHARSNPGLFTPIPSRYRPQLFFPSPTTEGSLDVGCRERDARNGDPPFLLTGRRCEMEMRQNRKKLQSRTNSVPHWEVSPAGRTHPKR
jgi:hypothetical protein